MKIKFNKLKIKNFLSIGEGEVTLKDRGYTLIKGINNNTKDNAVSNGSGKSSIFNAISYALTGQTLQGVSSNLKNIYTEGELEVGVNFILDDKEFIVTRTRNKSNKPELKIVVNGENVSGKTLRESEEILKSYFPLLTSELLGEVILIGQGMPHKFSKNTPSGRKEILEKLSNNDIMMHDIKNRVEERYFKLSENKREIDKKITQLETSKELYQKQYQENIEKLNKLKKESNIEYEKEILLLENKIKELKENKEEIQKDYLCSFELYNSYNNKYRETENEKIRAIEEEKNVFESFHSPLLKDIIIIENSLKSLEDRIKEKEKITDICPTCGQKLKGIIKPDLTEEYNKKENLKKEYDIIVEKSHNQEESFKLNKQDIEKMYLKKMEDIKNNFILPKEKEYKQKWEDLKNIEKEIEKETNTLNSYNTNSKLLASKIKEIEDSIISLEKNIEKSKNDLLYNIKEVTNLQNHLDVVNKMNLYVKRDFRGILLSNIISYIDAKSKEFAKEIFGNDDIEFALNGNNIDIKYCSKNLDTLSGGEQQKVDLIIQFAIRSMMQEYTGFNSNIIVLDEILDNLDSKGCDSVLTFITNRLSDIESIFIISHHADSLSICNDSTIKVIKNNGGISYINEE